MDKPDFNHSNAPAALAMNAETIRAHLFERAKELAAEMAEQGARAPESALITGAIEMAVMLWTQVGHGAGLGRHNVKRHLETQTIQFFTKHWNALGEAKEAKPS